MSKTAKEMWAEAGFKFFEEVESGIIYFDKAKSNGYINEGTRLIQIIKDGFFKGFCVRYYSSKNEEVIDFTPDMSMALIQQIVEFKR